MPKAARIKVRRQRILDLIGSNPHILIDDICAELSVKRNIVDRDIRALKSEKRLMRTGSPRAGEWHIL